MSEIEKMKRYIEQTKLDQNDGLYLSWLEVGELAKTAIRTKDDAITAVALAFNYGKAKGYRAARKEARA